LTQYKDPHPSGFSEHIQTTNSISFLKGGLPYEALAANYALTRASLAKANYAQIQASLAK
jgi:hypothetical protein